MSEYHNDPDYGKDEILEPCKYCGVACCIDGDEYCSEACMHSYESADYDTKCDWEDGVYYPAQHKEKA